MRRTRRGRWKDDEGLRPVCGGGVDVQSVEAKENLERSAGKRWREGDVEDAWLYCRCSRRVCESACFDQDIEIVSWILQNDFCFRHFDSNRQELLLIV